MKPVIVALQGAVLFGMSFVPSLISVENPPAANGSLLQARAAAKKPAVYQTGIASWYRGKAGRDGETNVATAAHRHLPIGTYVRVTNMNNNRSAVVKIKDRGPYIKNRIIDVNKQAAQELGMLNSGIARVHIEVLSQPQSGGP